MQRTGPIVYKNGRSYYTAEKIANARRNIDLYPWAKEISCKVVEAAEAYLTYVHDYLWNLVTSQKLPRSYGVNQTMGCPICRVYEGNVDGQSNHGNIGRRRRTARFNRQIRIH